MNAVRSFHDALHARKLRPRLAPDGQVHVIAADLLTHEPTVVRSKCGRRSILWLKVVDPRPTCRRCIRWCIKTGLPLAQAMVPNDDRQAAE